MTFVISVVMSPPRKICTNQYCPIQPPSTFNDPTWMYVYIYIYIWYYMVRAIYAHTQPVIFEHLR